MVLIRFRRLTCIPLSQAKWVSTGDNQQNCFSICLFLQEWVGFLPLSLILGHSCPISQDCEPGNSEVHLRKKIPP